MGKPVALDASADERETRGFISMTTMRPSRGFTANWMLQPPVSTPTPRMIAIAMSRIRWYSRSVSVMRRRHRHRVAGVHAHRVDVLDRADDHDVVHPVAHQLELVLLPAEDRLLEEHLGGRARLQTGTRDAAQVHLVVRHPGAGAAHRERGAHDDRVAEDPDPVQAVLQRVADHRGGRLRAQVRGQAGDDLLERLPVLAASDRVEVGADQLDAEALEDPLLVQRDGAVQRGLSRRGWPAARPAAPAR